MVRKRQRLRPADAVSVAYLDGTTNATIAENAIIYGSKAYYTCKTGYNLVGGYLNENYRFCGDSSWEPVADPTCQINNCGSLSVTPNLNLTVSVPATTYGSVATYSCISGFDFISQDYVTPHTGKRTCGTKAEGWLGSEPRCVPHVCGPITDIYANMASIEYTDFGYGPQKINATARLVCQSGYTNSAVTSMTCSATGWKGSLGTCVDIDECAITIPAKKCAQFGSQARCVNTAGSFVCPPFVLADSLSYLGNADGSGSVVTIGQNKRITLPDVNGGQILQFQVFEGSGNVPLSAVLPDQLPNTTISTYADGGVPDTSILVDVSFKNMDGWITSNALTYGCNNLRVQDSGLRMSSRPGSTIVPGSPDDLRIFTVTCTTTAGTGTDLYLRLHYCAAATAGMNPVCTYINLDRKSWSQPKDTTAMASTNFGYHHAYPPPSFRDFTVYSVSYSSEKSNSYVFMTSAAETIGMEVNNLFVARSELVSVYYGPESTPRKYKATFNQLQSLTLTNPPRILVFTSLNDGTGVNMPVTLQLANATITSSDVISYPQMPVVTSIEGCPKQKNMMAVDCPTDALTTAGGNVILTITGSDLYQPLTAYINGRQCVVQSITDTTSFTCVLPSGIGRNHALVLQSSLMRTLIPNAVSYSEPIIDKVTGCAGNIDTTHVFDCNRNGGDIITVEGRNFGSLGVTVSIDFLPCTEVTQDPTLMHKKFTCKLPAAVNKKMPIRIQQKYGLTTSTFTGFVSYIQCDKGFFNDGIYCTPCPVGTYTPAGGYNFCLSCPAGSYNSSPGSDKCNACDPGTSSTPKSSSCTLCPVGKFAPSGGGSCLICAADTYAPQPGTNACLPCPENAQNTIDYSFCECRAGYYMDNLGNCMPCLEGGNCLRTGTSLYSMESLPGFYSAIAAPKEPARKVRFRYLVMSNKLHEAILLSTGTTAIDAMISAVKTYMDDLMATNPTTAQISSALLKDLQTIVVLDEDTIRTSLMSVLYSYPWLSRHRIAVSGFKITKHALLLTDVAKILTRQVHIDSIVPPETTSTSTPAAFTQSDSIDTIDAADAGAVSLRLASPADTPIHALATWPPDTWPAHTLDVSVVQLELAVHPGTAQEESALSLAQRLQSATTTLVADPATDGFCERGRVLCSFRAYGDLLRCGEWHPVYLCVLRWHVLLPPQQRWQRRGRCGDTACSRVQEVLW